MNGLLPASALWVSSATHVIAIERTPAIEIPDPEGADHPPIRIPDLLRIELQLADHDDTTLQLTDIPAAAKAGTSGLLEEWRDLDVELEVYEFPWHAVYEPAPLPAKLPWVRSFWVARVFDTLQRWVDLPTDVPMRTVLRN